MAGHGMAWHCMAWQRAQADTSSQLQSAGMEGIQERHRGLVRAVMARCPDQLLLDPESRGRDAHGTLLRRLEAATRRLNVAARVAQARQQAPSAWAAMAPAVWAMEAGMVWALAARRADQELMGALLHLEKGMQALHGAMTHAGICGVPMLMPVPMDMRNAETLPAFMDTMRRMTCFDSAFVCVAGAQLCSVLRCAAPHELPQDLCAAAAEVVRASLDPSRVRRHGARVGWAGHFLPTLVRLGVAHFVLPPLIQGRLLQATARLLAGIAVSVMYAHSAEYAHLRALHRAAPGAFDVQEVHLECYIQERCSILEARMARDARFAAAFVARAMGRAGDLEVGLRVGVACASGVCLCVWARPTTRTPTHPLAGGAGPAGGPAGGSVAGEAAAAAARCGRGGAGRGGRRHRCGGGDPGGVRRPHVPGVPGLPGHAGLRRVRAASAVLPAAADARA